MLGHAPGQAERTPATAPTPVPPSNIGMTAPRPGATVGHQVIKFSPDGKALMTLGKPGGGSEASGDSPSFFLQPDDILVAPNGDFFVATGHGQAKPEVLKFSKDGKLIRRWGTLGKTPTTFIPDPNTKTRTADNFTATWSAEGVTVDSAGNVYGAEVGNMRLMKYEPVK